MGTKETQKDLVNMPISKRLFDVIFSLVIIFISLPFIFFIFGAIFVEHILRFKFWFPFFYTEKRVSQGESFDLIKFNIFKPGLVEDMRKKGVFIHTKVLEHDGHSLSFVGKILQMIYLDELPQFFNILKGDLSLVGPRPVNLEVYEDMLDADIYSNTVIKAGLTGAFQSRKGEEIDADIDLNHQYIEYCRNHSGFKIFLFDMKILLRTLKVLFKAQGI